MTSARAETQHLTYQRESLASTWHEGLDLIRANHAETGLPDERFDPDDARYFNLEAMNLMKLFTARYGDELVGYAVFLVAPHLHYKGVFWAMQDVLYVKPDHRGVGAVRFMEWQDEELAREGVERILRDVAERHDYHRTLERLGYEKVQTGYLRKVNFGH